MDPTWIIINTIDDPIPANAPDLIECQIFIDQYVFLQLIFIS